MSEAVSKEYSHDMDMSLFVCFGRIMTPFCYRVRTNNYDNRVVRFEDDICERRNSDFSAARQEFTPLDSQSKACEGKPAT